MPTALLTLLLLFAVLSAVVMVAGTLLSSYADVLAVRTGVGRTMGGLLLLASVTSLPELSVDCKAAWIGQPDIAVGAVLGSSIFNLLILGTLDLLFARQQPIISPASGGHILSAIATMILTSVVVAFVVLKELPLQWMSVGLGTFLAFLFYVFCLRVIYLDQLGRDNEDDGEGEAESIATGRAVLGYLVCALVILFAAGALAPTAERLAEVTKLGGTFVGSTFVALTTSLPELVTTLAAVRIGSYDMAVGNILGSNAFNMAILFPVDMFYRTGSRSLLRDAEYTHAVTSTLR